MIADIFRQMVENGQSTLPAYLTVSRSWQNDLKWVTIIALEGLLLLEVSNGPARCQDY